MKLTVTVKPNARKESVEQIDERDFIVKVHAPPHEGKANERMLKLLAQYFNVPPSRLNIRSGLSGRKKNVEIKY